MEQPPVISQSIAQRLCTKLYAAVSDDFLSLRFTLVEGQHHDITQGSTLIAGYTYELVIADTAYDSDAFRAEITAEGAEVVIRPRKNRTQDRPYDEVLYKLRNVIERFFIVSNSITGSPRAMINTLSDTLTTTLWILER